MSDTLVDREDLVVKILELLKTSSIPESKKQLLAAYLPIMQDEALQESYMTLKDEHEKLAVIDEKRRRLELKHQIISEKLNRQK